MRRTAIVLVALLLGGCEDTTIGPVFAFNNDFTGTWDARFDFASITIGGDTATYTRLTGTIEVTPNFTSVQIGSAVDGTITTHVELAGNAWLGWSATHPRGSAAPTTISVSQDTSLHVSWTEARAGSTIRLGFRPVGSSATTHYAATWTVLTVRVPAVLYDSTAAYTLEMKKRSD